MMVTACGPAFGTGAMGVSVFPDCGESLYQRSLSTPRITGLRDRTYASMSRNTRWGANWSFGIAYVWGLALQPRNTDSISRKLKPSTLSRQNEDVAGWNGLARQFGSEP